MATVAGRVREPYNMADGDNGGGGLQAHDYYIFVAIALIIIAALVVYFYKRKRGLKFTHARNGSAELARAVNTAVHREVMQNRESRRQEARRHEAACARREEGLNENGEAPPPYIPKAYAGDGAGHATERERLPGEAVPLQTLPPVASGDATHQSPPGYEELERYPGPTTNMHST